MTAFVLRLTIGSRSMFEAVSFLAIFFTLSSHAFALPPGLNTPGGVTDLSIAVQDGVGIKLSVPPNSPAGTTPNVTIPGAATANTIVISDQSETIGQPCEQGIIVGTLAETNTGVLLSCQNNGTSNVWQAAQGSSGWKTVNLTNTAPFVTGCIYYALVQYPYGINTYMGVQQSSGGTNIGAFNGMGFLVSASDKALETQSGNPVVGMYEDCAPGVTGIGF